MHFGANKSLDTKTRMKTRHLYLMHLVYITYNVSFGSLDYIRTSTGLWRIGRFDLSDTNMIEGYGTQQSRGNKRTQLASRF